MEITTKSNDRLVFTTLHPASHYGIPVLLVADSEIMPSDIAIAADSAVESIFGGDCQSLTGADVAISVAREPGRSPAERQALRLYCSQNPTGKQVDADADLDWYASQALAGQRSSEMDK
jgi:hypothetical protein